MIDRRHRGAVVRHLDALAARAGRPRAARAQAHRGVPADDHRWSRWKDRKKKIDWPLFPGYCFARFDPDDALPILKCTGVVNIVSFEGKPAPIPETSSTASACWSAASCSTIRAR